ncbi:MAG: hypothetical protein N2446_01200 [Elusimicrobiales bacterium]|nr:hypothetical protein [Elusimicrobiales bacterium]
MDLSLIEEIKEWFNSTDLDELHFKDSDFKLSLVKKGFNSEDLKINSNLTPVFAPEVGVFSFSKKGKAINIKKGDKVKKEDILGYINLPSKTIEVKSPVDGIIKLIAVEEGSLVEYSQLLFVIE